MPQKKFNLLAAEKAKSMVLTRKAGSYAFLCIQLFVSLEQKILWGQPYWRAVGELALTDVSNVYPTTFRLS